VLSLWRAGAFFGIGSAGLLVYSPLELAGFAEVGFLYVALHQQLHVHA